MKKKSLLILAAFSLVLISADSDDSLRSGVELFREGKFAEALAQFLSAEEATPDNPLPTYNAITAMAKAEKLAEMDAKLNEKFADLASNPEIRANSAYNLGTAYLSVAAKADAEDKLPEAAMEIDKSIQWLKQSLLDNHGDTEAKNNLEYALKLREKLQQQQDQQNQQNDENQNQKQNQDQQQQQENQDQQQDQQQQQQNQQQKQEQQQNQQQRQQQQQQKDISDATAENLLQAAKDAEKRAMKMMREQQNRKNRKKSPDGKDW